MRHFRIEDYDAVIPLWRRTGGVGLNESGTRRVIAAYLRRNPRLSFVAEKDGRIIGAVLCGHDGRRGWNFASVLLASAYFCQYEASESKFFIASKIFSRPIAHIKSVRGF